MVSQLLHLFFSLSPTLYPSNISSDTISHISLSLSLSLSLFHQQSFPTSISFSPLINWLCIPLVTVTLEDGSEVGSRVCCYHSNSHPPENNVITSVLTLSVQSGLALIDPEQRTATLILLPSGIKSCFIVFPYCCSGGRSGWLSVPSYWGCFQHCVLCCYDQWRDWEELTLPLLMAQLK